MEILIDTGATCLTLPSELFDMFRSWLPIRCDSAYNCWLTSDIQPNDGRKIPLPTLSFTMKQGGQEIIVPLTDLIFDGGKQIHNEKTAKLSAVSNTYCNLRLFCHSALFSAVLAIKQQRRFCVILSYNYIRC